ncbi:MAG: hypothetical protein WCC03_18575, partial [Candidatus Acidiferrales bacterium]
AQSLQKYLEEHGSKHAHVEGRARQLAVEMQEVGKLLAQQTDPRIPTATDELSKKAKQGEKPQKK